MEVLACDESAVVNSHGEIAEGPLVNLAYL